MGTEPPDAAQPGEAASALDAREIGARVQGVLLGVPLFLALLKLLSLTEGGGLFRYQGF